MGNEIDKNQLVRRINGLSKQALRVALYSLSDETREEAVWSGEQWQDMMDKGLF